MPQSAHDKPLCSVKGDPAGTQSNGSCPSFSERGRGKTSPASDSGCYGGGWQGGCKVVRFSVSITTVLDNAYPILRDGLAPGHEVNEVKSKQERIVLPNEVEKAKILRASLRPSRPSACRNRWNLAS